jgi:hypothetical protein
MITQSTVTANGETVPIWQTSAEQSWRLVHDGVNLLAIFESDGITKTRNTIFEAATRDECVAEIERLSLQDGNGILAKAAAQQLKDAYEQLKTQGESELEFAASLIAESGVNLDNVLSTMSTKRGVPILVK